MGLKEKYLNLKQRLSFLKWIDPFTYLEIVLRKFHPEKESPSLEDKAIDWTVYLISAAFFAFVLYSGIGLLLGTSSPMVIVLSPSMEPFYFRGDVIVLAGASPENINAPEVSVPLDSLEGVKIEEFAEVIPSQFSSTGERQQTTQIEVNGEVVSISKENDVVVYFSPYSRKEIIHRVAAKLKAGDGTYLLTKGDSEKFNYWIDQDCELVRSESGRVLRRENSCITLYPIKADSVKGKALFKIPLIGYVKLLVFDDLRHLLFGCPYPEGCPFP